MVKGKNFIPLEKGRESEGGVIKQTWLNGWLWAKGYVGGVRSPLLPFN